MIEVGVRILVRGPVVIEDGPEVGTERDLGAEVEIARTGEKIPDQDPEVENLDPGEIINERILNHRVMKGQKDGARKTSRATKRVNVRMRVYLQTGNLRIQMSSKF